MYQPFLAHVEQERIEAGYGPWPPEERHARENLGVGAVVKIGHRHVPTIAMMSGEWFWIVVLERHEYDDDVRYIGYIANRLLWPEFHKYQVFAPEHIFAINSDPFPRQELNELLETYAREVQELNELRH
jgi:hypothetical protein